MHASSGLTQGSNPHLLCLLHWQADSLPQCHQGSPLINTVYQSYLIHIDTHAILILSKIYINIFSALIIYFFIVYSVAQSCPTLCSPVNCTVHQAPFHGIFQARIPEQVAISCSRRSSQPRDQTHISCVSCIGRQILYHFATWESLIEKGIHAPVQSWQKHQKNPSWDILLTSSQYWLL